VSILVWKKRTSVVDSVDPVFHPRFTTNDENRPDVSTKPNPSRGELEGGQISQRKREFDWFALPQPPPESGEARCLAFRRWLFSKQRRQE
jgi:hypothetical protein